MTLRGLYRYYPTARLVIARSEATRQSTTPSLLAPTPPVAAPAIDVRSEPAPTVGNSVTYRIAPEPRANFLLFSHVSGPKSRG
jgi:hypothetical protein